MTIRDLAVDDEAVARADIGEADPGGRDGKDRRRDTAEKFCSCHGRYFLPCDGWVLVRIRRP